MIFSAAFMLKYGDLILSVAVSDCKSEAGLELGDWSGWGVIKGDGLSMNNYARGLMV